MPDRTIRSALYAAAGGQCAQVRRPGDEPCYLCRMVARDIVLAFLDAMPREAITPLELRLKLIVQGADG